jgi:hypothetical protein
MAAEFPVQALVVMACIAARVGLPVLMIWLLGRVLQRVSSPLS